MFVTDVLLFLKARDLSVKVMRTDEKAQGTLVGTFLISEKMFLIPCVF